VEKANPKYEHMTVQYRAKMEKFMKIKRKERLHKIGFLQRQENELELNKLPYSEVVINTVLGEYI